MFQWLRAATDGYVEKGAASQEGQKQTTGNSALTNAAKLLGNR
jgi:hypothetical protein